MNIDYGNGKMEVRQHVITHGPEAVIVRWHENATSGVFATIEARAMDGTASILYVNYAQALNLADALANPPAPGDRE